MDMPSGAQPDVAVDAGAGIPARVGLGGVVGDHADRIFLPIFQVRGEIHDEAGIAIRLRLDELVVDRDFGVHVHAFKLELHALPAPFFRDQELLAVVGDPAGKISALAAGRVAGSARLGDHRVMGQDHRLPGMRVEHGGKPGSFGEFPAQIKILLFHSSCSFEIVLDWIPRRKTRHIS